MVTFSMTFRTLNQVFTVTAFLKSNISKTDDVVLSPVVSEIFNVEKYRNLEIPVKDQSRSLKVVPFGRLGTVSY